jgi:outer membrane protein assembly factor BamB
MKRLIPLLGVCLLASMALAADWPQLGGLYGVFKSGETGVNKSWKTAPPPVVWQIGLSDNGYSGMSVSRGRVFIVDHVGNEDLVRCLNLKNATEFWRQKYTDAANPIGGYGFARATPTVDGDVVYTCSGTGKLICWKFDKGDKVWEKNITTDLGGRMPQWGYSASPFIDGNKLIVVTGGQGLICALDKTTGALLWKGGVAENASYATPVKATINGVPQYLVFSGKRLYGLKAENGEKLWAYDWPTGAEVNAALPIVGGNYVFITSAYGQGCAMIEITADGPQERWRNKEMASHFQTPIAAGGYIYGKNDHNDGAACIVCLEAKTGNVMWKKQGFTKGGIIAVDGTLIITSGRSGETVQFELNPTAYTELGRIRPFDGMEQCWVAPVLSEGHLLVRTVSHMACLYIGSK